MRYDTHWARAGANLRNKIISTGLAQISGARLIKQRGKPHEEKVNTS